MRFTRLSSLLVAATLIAAPATAAFANPTTAQTSERAPAPPVAPSSDAAQYAAREAKDHAVQTFQGGGEVVVISSSVGLILLVLLLVIVL